MWPPQIDTDQSLRRAVIFILLIIGLGGGVDLILDQDEWVLNLHVIFEIGMLFFSLSAAAYLWLGWRRAGSSLADARRELEGRSVERDQWRRRAEKILRGLGVEIDLQLRTWGLTAAERETALLVLKGYGYKEIAGLQHKSERTVRQHAGTLYRKASVSGRAEFSAFFLEDLLLPLAEPEPEPQG
jgi:DNA-binding CsgD family transcriptional regulator